MRRLAVIQAICREIMNLINSEINDKEMADNGKPFYIQSLYGVA